MTPLIANFHGLGTPSDAVDAAERPYWLSEPEFLSALDYLVQSGSELLVTFDDGNLSDLEIGVPACADRGIAAIVFACSNRIGKPGYLGTAELRQIATMPHCSIGSHGADHIVWRGLEPARLAAEITESKAVLEQAVGSKIIAAGIPFGAYDRRTLQALLAAGYTKIYSSDGGPRLLANGVYPRRTLRSDNSVQSQISALLASRSALTVLRQEVRLQLKALR